jgi:hypothetical protein
LVPVTKRFDRAISRKIVQIVKENARSLGPPNESMVGICDPWSSNSTIFLPNSTHLTDVDGGARVPIAKTAERLSEARHHMSSVASGGPLSEDSSTESSSFEFNSMKMSQSGPRGITRALIAGGRGMSISTQQTRYEISIAGHLDESLFASEGPWTVKVAKCRDDVNSADGQYMAGRCCVNAKVLIEGKDNVLRPSDGSSIRSVILQDDAEAIEVTFSPPTPAQ